MNKINKFILSGVLFALLAVQARAASVTLTLTTTSTSNLVSTANGPVTLKKFVLMSAANATTAIVNVYDSPTNIFVYTNLAYIARTQYPTNIVTTWTNYYGATNHFTNNAVFYATNTVAEVDNIPYPRLITLTAPTNSGSITLDNVNIQFNQGVWVTNTGSGTVTITAEYVQ